MGCSEMEENRLVVWGNSQQGQLGLGSGEEENSCVRVPRLLSPFWQPPQFIRQVVCATHHTLFVLSDGSVWSCGNNDYGQLGRDVNPEANGGQGNSLRKPGRVEALQYHSVTQAAAGVCHSLALSEAGQVFSWGSSASGQCGRQSDAEGFRIPKLVRSLALHVVIQISAGGEFSLALTEAGEVFMWGRNDNGQLGVGADAGSNVDTPRLVIDLVGLPIRQISAGSAHSLILTTSGFVFSAGRNDFGQLGLGDTNSRNRFSSIKSLKNQRVCYAACGEDHSAVLTTDGGIFTFGAGGSGQLGHGSIQNEMMPRKVFELMGSTVSQLCCGSFHSLAYVPSSNRLYAFGKSGSGQLGTGTRDNVRSPALCPAWPAGHHLQELFAGGDQSMALITSAPAPVDFRRHRPALVPFAFTPILIDDLCQALTNLPESESLLEDSLHRQLETVSGSLSAWNGSFLGPGEEHFACGVKNSGVDLPVARDALSRLSAVLQTRPEESESVTELIRRKLLPALPDDPASIECLRVYLLLPLFPLFTSPLDAEEVMRAIMPFAMKFSHLRSTPDQYLRSWLSLVPIDIFQHFVELYKASVVMILRVPKIGELVQKEEYWRGTQALLDALALLHDTNSRLRSQTSLQAIPYEQFYIPEILDKVNIHMDYKHWYYLDMEKRQKTLSFCNYPFTFDPPAKTMLLQADSLMQMEKAISSMNHGDLMQNFIRAATQGGQGPASFNPQQVVFLNLYVSREELLKDTLDQIYQFKSNDLKRPLKIWFKDEEAEDAGGVKKEFFMLLTRELLDPKYGMFTYYEETKSIYFNGKSFETLDKFFMIGIICGLAIYNSVIVDAHFPLLVYKKLLNIKPTLIDLDGLMPTVRRSLEQLLQYENDDLEEVFQLNFTVIQESFGEMLTVPLKANGENVAVIKDNRQEYVELYIDWALNRAVKDQFQAFYEGFHRVCGGRILELFQAQELMAMVCGNENYDWKEMEQETVYKGEYSADHPTIRLFWRVFHSLDLEQKKKFLLFLTGCDRIPILGMKAIKMTIQPTGGGDTFLPVAHTCFDILDLPKYRDEVTLRDKLLISMENTMGFGLA